MGDVPYRLWSDEAPEPPAPSRTLVVKLKPTTSEGRRAAFGARSETERAARRRDEEPRPSQIGRLLDNARLKWVKSVFPEEALAAHFRGNARGARRSAAERPVVQCARGLATIEIARGEDPKRMARHLEALGAEVDYAFVPQPRRMFAKKKPPSKKTVDPLLSRQWGHTAVRVAQARKRAGFVEATKITVGVADSGIDAAHPDLKSVISEYKNFLKGEGAKDYAGHGTHVAGIIAAQMNNGVGIAGLCAAKILALKVLPDRVDWDAAAYYRGLAYCIGRARVLNLSLGAEEFDAGERDVISDLLDEGVVVIAAMGNEFEEGNPVEYPAALKGVCAVGATDHADRRGGFSNTGKHISLAAPGVAIVSTTPTYTYGHGKRDYDTWDGTSMATPHVSAAAALLLADDPDLTPAQVVKKLQQSADKVPGMTKRPNNNFGWGRLNIDAALR
jgi:subtilisin family serine protease